MNTLFNLKNRLLFLINKNFTGIEILFFSILGAISLIAFCLFINYLLSFFLIDRIVYKGEINEGIVGTIKNSHRIFGNEETTKSIEKILYHPLIKKNDNKEIVYILTDQIEKKDNTIIQIRLKPNLKFSDGKIITIDDVLFTWNKLKESEFTKTYKNILNNLELEKKDNYNLTIKLKKDISNVDLLFEVGILPKHYFENTENQINNLNLNTIGSGNFKIKSIDYNKNIDNQIQTIYFERFDNNSKIIPYINKFNLHFFNNSQDATNALFKKEINLITNIDIDGLERLKIKNQNLKSQSNPTDTHFALFINPGKSEILRSNKFRKILNMAIDRKFLSQQILKDFATAKELLFSDEVTTYTKESIDKIIASTTLTIESDGMFNSIKEKNIKKKTGDQIELTISTPNIKELIDTANFVKNEYSKLGIKVNIDILSNETLPDIIKERKFEILLFALDLQNDSDLYNFFHSSQRKYPKLNISGYTSQRIDKLTEQLTNNSSEDNKSEILNQIQTEISNDLPIILLYKQNNVSVYIEDNTKIVLSKNLKSTEDKYKYLDKWYTNTEKIYSFWNFKFINTLEKWIY